MVIGYTNHGDSGESNSLRKLATHKKFKRVLILNHTSKLNNTALNE